MCINMDKAKVMFSSGFTVLVAVIAMGIYCDPTFAITCPWAVLIVVMWVSSLGDLFNSTTTAINTDINAANSDNIANRRSAGNAGSAGSASFNVTTDMAVISAAINAADSDNIANCSTGSGAFDADFLELIDEINAAVD